MAHTCQIHGSAVELAGRAVVITGLAGSGKSTLCLEMIALGATLIADDRVDLTRRDDDIFASAPDTITGLIEARGVGLIRMDTVHDIPVAWIVDLDETEIDRMPHQRTRPLLEVRYPVIFGKNRVGLAAILINLLRFGRCEPEG